MSATLQQAYLGGFPFALPAILLSGVMTPIRSMPGWMQALTSLNPVRSSVEVLRGSFLRGAGASNLWTPMAFLAACGALILGFASVRFRKRAERPRTSSRLARRRLAHCGSDAVRRAPTPVAAIVVSAIQPELEEDA